MLFRARSQIQFCENILLKWFKNIYPVIEFLARHLISILSCLKAFMIEERKQCLTNGSAVILLYSAWVKCSLVHRSQHKAELQSVQMIRKESIENNHSFQKSIITLYLMHLLLKCYSKTKLKLYYYFGVGTILKRLIYNEVLFVSVLSPMKNNTA